MDFDIEVAGPDDYPEAIGPTFAAFGMAAPSEEELDDQRQAYDDYRLLVAREGGRSVGTLGDYPFELTLPGGRTIDVAGVTMAGVLPTHRRRGILTALMTRLLDDTVERGWPAAVLLASESAIYDRYGYGVASRFVSCRIDPRSAALREEPAPGGTLRLAVDTAEALPWAREVWEGFRTARPGLTTRRPWMWELWRRDRVDERDGASGWFWAFHVDDTGRPDGYVRYRVKEQEAAGLPDGEARVAEIVAADPEVEAALFAYVCRIDLVRRVVLSLRPLDDHLPWRLRDPRQMSVFEGGDMLWLRVLDVPRILAARTYGTADRFVLEVDDPFRPAAGGRFVLETATDGARCEAADAGAGPADLTLGASALGSLVLGTVSSSTLAAAGLVRAEPQVLRRADAAFRCGPAPWAITEF